MKNDSLWQGVHYLFRGLNLLQHRQLRAYIGWPITLNFLVYLVLLVPGIYFFQVTVHALMQWLPTWLHWLAVLLWLLFSGLILLVFIYTFTWLANLIAVPFNSALANRVEALINQQPIKTTETLGSQLRAIPAGFIKQLQFIIYYLIRVIVIVPLLFIPVVHIIGVMLWFWLTAWLLALQYLDCPMDNHGYRFKELQHFASQQRYTTIGFGSSVLILMFIPILNLLVMPAAVIGATLWWLEQSNFRSIHF